MRVVFKALASVGMIALSTAAAIGIRRVVTARNARKAAEDFAKANADDPDIAESGFDDNHDGNNDDAGKPEKSDDPKIDNSDQIA